VAEPVVKEESQGTKNGPDSPVARSDDDKAETETERHAVVIVHGVGEQRPLETLRSFVQAVWGGSTKDTWIVPDSRSGLTELARISTRPRGSVRTDFYELYWSDLLIGNTLAQLRGWVFGLLLRWPHQVPRETALLWALLWFVVIEIVFILGYVGAGFSWDALAGLFDPKNRLQNNWTLLISVAVAAVTAIFLWRRLIRAMEIWNRGDIAPLEAWTRKKPSELSLDQALSVLVVVVGPVLIGWALYNYMPWQTLKTERTFWLLVAGVLIWIISELVVPYFGDVARYVRVAPDAVHARAAIRERGVELLRALHKPAGKSARDGNEEKIYSRIVIVGHSLGSIIAYDVMRLYWQEYGPTGRNPPTGAVAEALEKLDVFCATADPDPKKFDIRGYREGQRAVFDALSASNADWRISDFITLGSPLAHGEFLVSRDRVSFEERKLERMFPTTPPMLEYRKPKAAETGEEKPIKSFRYRDKNGALVAHHGAQFAAVCWVNIYDQSKNPLLGDFISGPCRPNFGPGVIDLPVKISGRGLRGRVFTHTLYWDQFSTGVASDGVGRRLGIENLSQEAQAHLTLLRKALEL
jgi:hypothetical protein